ncbi:MAG: hypothetical protein N2043_01830 [Ignavibacterium sp.]|nr:hypothetical protein [Ignavibacterium sp.]
MSLSLSDLKEQLHLIEQDIWRLEGEIETIENYIIENEEIKQQEEENEQNLEKMKIILQKASEESRQKACVVIERIATQALQYIFGPQYELKLELKQARGRAEANVYVSTEVNGEKIWLSPEESRGGGMVDVISLALRFAFTEIWNNPVLSGPILLDEPGKHVSEEYAIKLSQFIDYLQKHFNRQIIYITHQPHMAEMAYASFYVYQNNGESFVVRQTK